MNSLRSILFRAYQKTGLADLCARNVELRGRSAMTILLLHRVTDAIPEDPLTISVGRFRDLCALLQAQFQVVSLSELMHFVRCGPPYPPRTVAITFDDCYRNNHQAAEILSEFSLPACFFVTAGFVGTDHVFEWDQHLPVQLPNLTWQQVRDIAAMGHEIGSHTVTHPDMGRIDERDARAELVESKAILEDRVGQPVRWFAFPFGRVENFRSQWLPLVYEAGYEGCFAGQYGRVHPDRDYAVMPRTPVPAFNSLLQLELFMKGSLDWYYRLRKWAGTMPAALASPPTQTFAAETLRPAMTS